MISSFQTKYNLSNVNFGPLYSVWILLTLGMFLQVFWNYILARKQASSVEQIKMRYVFYGFGFWSIIVSVFSIVVPLSYGFNNNFSLVAAPSLIFSGIVAYAIINKRLMDLRLFTTKIVSYSFITLFVIAFYTGILKVFDTFIFPLTIGQDQFLMSIILVLTTAYILPIVKDYFENLAKKIFYKEGYDLNQVLGRISVILGTEIVLRSLLAKVTTEIFEALKIKFVAVFLISSNKAELENGVGEYEAASKLKLDDFRKLFSYKRVLYSFDDLKVGTKRRIMDAHQLGCVVELLAKEETIGYLVLGRRKSNEIFTVEDLRLLEILAPQLSVAIQNSQRYEEIQAFSKKLEFRVREATGKLRVVNYRLKELDKLKDEFVSVAAHELRAPLTAVRGYLSMVLEGDAGKVSKRINEFLDGALEGTEREVRLVNNMLNVSRIEEGRLVFNMGKLDLARVVESVFKEFKYDAERKKIKYSLEMKKDIKDRVYVDEDRIHEVVANLISNAIKYTDKGFVKVRVLESGDNKVRFEIEDSGYGIAEEEQKDLFQKFKRTESSGGRSIGTGLGLYIVKLLVKKFKGEIGVESRLGKGSKFWFELPVVK